MFRREAIAAAVLLALSAAGRCHAQPHPDPFNYPADERWVAQWIWGHEMPHGAHGYFRAIVEVGPGLVSAWAQLSGDAGYTLMRT